MVAAVTASSSAVAKGLPGDRNKFPIIACWIQCELQHAMSDVITNFAVRFDGAELVKGSAAQTCQKKITIATERESRRGRQATEA